MLKTTPNHFFEVIISGICRRAAGTVLNRDAVRAYIAEACPVPINQNFRFATEVDELLTIGGPSMTLRVTLDEEVTPIVRPYKNGVWLSPVREDKFTELEPIQVPSVDSDSIAAVGWIAHSSYMGAITPDTGVRGIRAREGNIQIGDEGVFTNLFPEERFNRWCVGEVHILDPRIIPNGRRDYFEPSPHTRNLENHLRGIFRSISIRCRKASSVRNSAKQVSAATDDLRIGYELARSGYLPPEESKRITEISLTRIESVRAKATAVGGGELTEIVELTKLERKFRKSDSPGAKKSFADACSASRCLPKNLRNSY